MHSRLPFGSRRSHREAVYSKRGFLALRVIGLRRCRRFRDRVPVMNVDRFRAALGGLLRSNPVVRDVAGNRLEVRPFRIAAIFVHRFEKPEKRVLRQLLRVFLGHPKGENVKANHPLVVLPIKRLEPVVVRHRSISSPRTAYLMGALKRLLIIVFALCGIATMQKRHGKYDSVASSADLKPAATAWQPSAVRAGMRRHRRQPCRCRADAEHAAALYGCRRRVLWNGSPDPIRLASKRSRGRIHAACTTRRSSVRSFECVG